MRKADNLTTFGADCLKKSGSLNVLEPYWPVIGQQRDCFYRDLIPGHPVRSESLYRLPNPGTLLKISISKIDE